MTGAGDWSSRGAATGTLSDRRPAAAGGFFVPEPRRPGVPEPRLPEVPEPRPSDDWPGAAPPAGWFLNAAGPAPLRDVEPEPDSAPDPVVFGPAASPWQRSHHLWAQSGIDWEQLTPLPSDDTRQQAEPHQPRPRPGGRRTHPPGRHARPRSAQAERIEHQYANLLGAPVPASPQLLDLAPRPADTTGQQHRPLAEPGTGQDYRPLAMPGAEPDRPRLLFGHRVLAIGVPVLVLTMVGALAVALLTGHGPKLGQPPLSQDGPGAAQQDASAGLVPTALPTYPGQQQRGVFEAFNRIVVSGDTIVATGQLTGAGLSRQQFYVSTNGGSSWQLAAQTVAGGTDSPAPGHIAQLLAGGPGGWLAVGKQAIWTSRDGTAWTLAASHGISQIPGDNIQVLTRTAGGYLAGGSDAQGQAVVWTSPDGVHWQRMTGGQLGIHALSVAYATAHGTDILITGTRAHGGSGAWLSGDGGRSWTAVTIPADHGGSTAIAGVGWDNDGLVAVRDGAAGGGAAGDAIAYFSRNGTSWDYAGTIGAASGLRPRVVKGNGYGLVVAGQNNSGQLVAYLSADNGTTWRPTAILGNAAAESVVGAAVAPGGTAIAIGATAANKVSQQGVFVAATADSAQPVTLPAANIPELSVSATAQSGGEQIAVGSANGYPAIWRRTGSTWSLVTQPGQFSAQLPAGKGLASLTDVVHGPSGWLAVGSNLILTSPDGVTWHAAGGTAALAAADFLAAAAGPAGYVVVGEQMTHTGSVPVSVWFPADLSGPRMASGTGHPGQMLAVTATASGFAAVGTADRQPALWVSRDGKTWTLTDLSPAGSVLRQVAALGNRIVVTGTNAAGAPLVLLSADGGTTWHVTELPRAGRPVTVTALTAGPHGFTAAGVTGTAGDEQFTEWRSADGAAWTPAAAGAAAGTRSITALTSTGSSVTGIGEIAAGQSQQSVQWSS